MVKLTELPCEIITDILEQGSVRDVFAAVRTCRRIRDCFKQRPSLASQVILRHIPEELLPYAVAALYADHLPIPRTEAMVQNLINWLGPSFLLTAISLVRRLGLGNLLKLEDLHNIIHSMALDYANEAWDFMQTTNMHVPSPGTLQLSRNEYLRFCRAFYRVEIRHSIERPKPVGPHRPRAWNEGEDFLHPLPSYDQEQMGCVLEYQERLFLNSELLPTNARRKLALTALFQAFTRYSLMMLQWGILALTTWRRTKTISFKIGQVQHQEVHDVELLVPCPLAILLASWLSANIVSQLKRGLRFLVKITSDLSYDEKKNLLYAKYGPGEWADLWKSLDADRDWLEEDRQLADDPWVQNEDDGGLIHVFKDRVDAMDLDLGPRGAFMRSISRALADLTTIDFIPTDGLRDRAYVLWDRDRLLQLQAGWVFPPGLLNPMDFLAYESKPRRGPDYRERLAAEKTLKESLQASKEIWDKGGSGYWSADDLSKVVWGGDRWTPHEYPPKDRW